MRDGDIGWRSVFDIDVISCCVEPGVGGVCVVGVHFLSGGFLGRGKEGKRKGGDGSWVWE